MKFSAAALFLVSSTTLTLEVEGGCPKSLARCVKKCKRQNKCKKKNKVGKVTRCENKCMKRCTRKLKRCSKTASPTASPTISPTASPTISPTTSPTTSPTASPTISPTTSPTASPTTSPTTSPTMSPTTSPTAAGPTAGPADAIGAGQHFTCAIVPGGDVKCWGYGLDGALGNGTQTPTLTGDAVTALISGKATDIGVGHFHSCAILDSEAVECWGKNAYGQLGDGTINNPRTTPVSMVGLGGAKPIQVSVGRDFSCVLLDSGAVKCVGRRIFGALGNGGSYGALGPGSTAFSTTLVDVQGLSGAVTAIDSSFGGGGHTCAIISGGGLDCWGYNGYGALGNGYPAASYKTTAVSVGISGKAISVSAGDHMTCVLLDSGNAECMGYNAYGQLGDGTKINRNTPVSVLGLGGKAVAVGAGRHHSCFLLDDGGVKCTGRGNSGQLGDGTNTDRSTPVSVVGLASKAVAIAVGYEHSCALLDDDKVQCWGNNIVGALGDESLINKATPVYVFAI